MRISSSSKSMSAKGSADLMRCPSSRSCQRGNPGTAGSRRAALLAKGALVKSVTFRPNLKVTQRWMGRFSGSSGGGGVRTRRRGLSRRRWRRCCGERSRATARLGAESALRLAKAGAHGGPGYERRLDLPSGRDRRDSVVACVGGGETIARGDERATTEGRSDRNRAWLGEPRARQHRE
jgi:hypothetical protein